MCSYSTFRAMLDVCCRSIHQSHCLQAHGVHSINIVICMVTVAGYGSVLHFAWSTILLQIFYAYLSHLQLLLPLSGKGWPAAGPHPHSETPCPGCPDSPGLTAWSACTNQPTAIIDLVLNYRNNRPEQLYCYGLFLKLCSFYTSCIFIYYILPIFSFQTAKTNRFFKDITYDYGFVQVHSSCRIFYLGILINCVIVNVNPSVLHFIALILHPT